MTREQLSELLVSRYGAKGEEWLRRAEPLICMTNRPQSADACEARLIIGWGARKGELDGDDLRALAERAPALFSAIRPAIKVVGRSRRASARDVCTALEGEVFVEVEGQVRRNGGFVFFPAPEPLPWRERLVLAWGVVLLVLRCILVPLALGLLVLAATFSAAGLRDFLSALERLPS